MNRAEALGRLGLSDVADSSGTIEEELARRTVDLENRISSAPTDSLRQKYIAERGELDQIRAALQLATSPPGLSATQFRDVPGARPAFTSDGRDAPGKAVAVSEGQVLLGRYELRRRLGAGGMGVVHAAYDRSAQEEIAIKFLLPSLVSDDAARARFLAEGQASRRLAHPNIVRVYDVQSEGELHFLTMELLEGRTLREELERRRQEDRRFSVEDVLRFGQTLCEALIHAHRTTVHRDIKPENIWLCPDGAVKLLDFGVARLMRTSQLTRTGMALGTAYYMAPEQLQAASEVDGRADQYALAAVLYEMLIGKVPAGRARSAREIRRDVPAALSGAVDRALSSEPIDRFSDMAAFATAMSTRLLRLSSRAVSVGASVLAVALLAAASPLWGPAVTGWLSAIRHGPETAESAQARVVKLRELLEDDRRSLAERTESATGTQRTRLEEIRDQAERDVFGGEEAVTLEGLASVGELQLNGKDYGAAIETYREAERLAQRLRNSLITIEEFVVARSHARSARSKWQNFKSGKTIVDPESAREADSLFASAEREMELEKARDEFARATELFGVALAEQQGIWAKGNAERNARELRERFDARKQTAANASREWQTFLAGRSDIASPSIASRADDAMHRAESEKDLNIAIGLFEEATRLYGQAQVEHGQNWSRHESKLEQEEIATCLRGCVSSRSACRTDAESERDDCRANILCGEICTSDQRSGLAYDCGRGVGYACEQLNDCDASRECRDDERRKCDNSRDRSLNDCNSARWKCEDACKQR